MSSPPPVPGPARPGPFHDQQRALGARFGDIGGWRVPLSYGEGTADRLRTARDAAVLADLTPLGRLKVTGKDRQGLLQRISTNDLRPLEAGRFAPTVFVTPKGRIVDRALVFDRGDSYMILTSPAGRERLAAWIRKYALAEEIQVTDVSREMAGFALAGPRAQDLVKELAAVGVGSLEPGRFLGLPVAEILTLIAPYDGLPSAWLLLAEIPGIAAVHERALAAGAPRGAVPIGAEEAEILRVEAGIPADGHELTEDWNPWEARLDPLLSPTKGCYTGQEVVARLRTYDKVQRRLAGLRMGRAEPPDPPQPVFSRNESGEESEVGTLTSAVRSDRLGETIGLAFIRIAFEEPGTALAVGPERSPAVVSALPF